MTNDSPPPFDELPPPLYPLHLLPREWAADINPLISPQSAGDTYQRILDLLDNLHSHASEFYEVEGYKLLPSNPLYLIVEGAMHYEALKESGDVQSRETKQKTCGVPLAALLRKKGTKKN